MGIKTFPAMNWKASGTSPTDPGGGGGTLLAQPNAQAGLGSFNHPINSSTDRGGFIFVPDETGTITTLYIYVKTDEGPPAYGNDNNGDGLFGTARVRIHEDNGGALGTQVGDTYQVNVPSESTNGGLLPCTVNAPVTAGVAYQVEVANVHASPTTEWFSINNHHVRPIAGHNDAYVASNALYPQGRSRHGLDPRAVSKSNGSYASPSDSDGHAFPAYWLVFSNGHEEGQIRYSAGNGQGEPLSRTYTVKEYEAGLATHILMHGRGRAPEGTWSVTVDVTVNAVNIANNVPMAGSANVTAALDTPTTLVAGDIVVCTVSNVTNITHPYMDAAGQTVSGCASKPLLPICIIGIEA